MFGGRVKKLRFRMNMKGKCEKRSEGNKRRGEELFKCL